MCTWVYSIVGLFKGDQATAEQYQNLLDPLLKETRDGELTCWWSLTNMICLSIVKLECVEVCRVWKLYDDWSSMSVCLEIILVTTPCLKKTVSTYFLLLLCQIRTDFNKIGRIVPEETFNKTVPKCPLHLKYVLELPWEIWSVRLSRQCSN